MSTIRIPGIKNEDREDNSKVAAAVGSTEDIHCHRCGRKIFTGTCGIPGSDDRIFEGDAGCFPVEGGENCGYPCPGGQLSLSARPNSLINRGNSESISLSSDELLSDTIMILQAIILFQ